MATDDTSGNALEKSIEDAERDVQKTVESFGQDSLEVAVKIDALVHLLKGNRVRLLEAANLQARADKIRCYSSWYHDYHKQKPARAHQPDQPVEFWQNDIVKVLLVIAALILPTLLAYPFALSAYRAKQALDAAGPTAEQRQEMQQTADRDMRMRANETRDALLRGDSSAAESNAGVMLEEARSSGNAENIQNAQRTYDDIRRYRGY